MTRTVRENREAPWAPSVDDIEPVLNHRSRAGGARARGRGRSGAPERRRGGSSGRGRPLGNRQEAVGVAGGIRVEAHDVASPVDPRGQGCNAARDVDRGEVERGGAGGQGEDRNGDGAPPEPPAPAPGGRPAGGGA